jgi:hypothetical protein
MLIIILVESAAIDKAFFSSPKRCTQALRPEKEESCAPLCPCRSAAKKIPEDLSLPEFMHSIAAQG